MKTIEAFMLLYMYELEKFLLLKKDELKTISFQLDEANTDRPLKEYLKNVIESSFSKIPVNSNILAIEFENEASIDADTLRNIHIEKVLLPEEITEEIRKIISETKKATFTNPDMCLEIILDGNVYYETIELKSTKKDAIPGSSVQQVQPYEWVIFIKHTKTDIEITTGQYIHAINSKMQFPDRSPRPQISFQEMETWNQLNRISSYANKLIYKKDSEQTIKYDLIKDWQNVLSERWIDMIFNTEKVRKNEPWFNNNMRKFILAFLEKYELLSEDEKQKFKEKIQALIKEA